HTKEIDLPWCLGGKESALHRRYSVTLLVARVCYIGDILVACTNRGDIAGLLRWEVWRALPSEKLLFCGGRRPPHPQLASLPAVSEVRELPERNTMPYRRLTEAEMQTFVEEFVAYQRWRVYAAYATDLYGAAAERVDVVAGIERGDEFRYLVIDAVEVF